MDVTAVIQYYKKNLPSISLIEPTVRWLKNLYLEECAKKLLDVYSSKLNKLPYKKYGWTINIIEEVDCPVQA